MQIKFVVNPREATKAIVEYLIRNSSFQPSGKSYRIDSSVVVDGDKYKQYEIVITEE